MSVLAAALQSPRQCVSATRAFAFLVPGGQNVTQLASARRSCGASMSSGFGASESTKLSDASRTERSVEPSRPRIGRSAASSVVSTSQRSATCPSIPRCAALEVNSPFNDFSCCASAPPNDESKASDSSMRRSAAAANWATSIGVVLSVLVFALVYYWWPKVGQVPRRPGSGALARSLEGRSGCRRVEPAKR